MLCQQRLIQFYPVAVHLTKHSFLSSWANRRKVIERTSTLNHFEILEVKKDALSTEIKLAFYKKAKLLHPDVNRGMSLEVANAKFIELKDAYEILNDPILKLRYIRKMNSSFAPDRQNRNNEKNAREYDARQDSDQGQNIRYDDADEDFHFRMNRNRSSNRERSIIALATKSWEDFQIELEDAMAMAYHGPLFTPDGEFDFPQAFECEERSRPDITNVESENGVDNRNHEIMNVVSGRQVLGVVNYKPFLKENNNKNHSNSYDNKNNNDNKSNDNNSGGCGRSSSNKDASLMDESKSEYSSELKSSPFSNPSPNPDLNPYNPIRDVNPNNLNLNPNSNNPNYGLDSIPISNPDPYPNSPNPNPNNPNPDPDSIPEPVDSLELFWQGSVNARAIRSEGIVCFEVRSDLLDEDENDDGDNYSDSDTNKNDDNDSSNDGNTTSDPPFTTVASLKWMINPRTGCEAYYLFDVEGKETHTIISQSTPGVQKLSLVSVDGYVEFVCTRAVRP